VAFKFVTKEMLASHILTHIFQYIFLIG